MHKILCSLRKKGGLKERLQSYVFDDVRNKLVSAHCTETSYVLTCQFLYSSTVCVMLDGSQQESRERGVHFARSSEQIHGPTAPCLDVNLVACVEM